MSTSEWIIVIVVFLAAGALFCLGIHHFMERGFLLNNAYIYASQKERQTMNKKPYYRQSAIVFCLLGMIFVLIGFSVVLQNNSLLLPEAVLLIGTVIYAIVSSVQISKKH